jgi:hypothetical protein
LRRGGSGLCNDRQRVVMGPGSEAGTMGESLKLESNRHLP